MDLAIGLTAVLGVPALLACLWYGISRRKPRSGSWRGATSGMVGIADEVFRPETHQAQQIQVIQQELPAPAPALGDLPNPNSGDN